VKKRADSYLQQKLSRVSDKGGVLKKALWRWGGGRGKTMLVHRTGEKIGCLTPTALFASKTRREKKVPTAGQGGRHRI